MAPKSTRKNCPTVTKKAVVKLRTLASLDHELKPEPHTNESLALLLNSLPCREKLVQDLISMFGESLQITPQCLFLYGHTSSGKSLVVDSIMQHLNLPLVKVNCVECYSSNILYQEIIQNMVVRKQRYFSDNPIVIPRRCDSMNDFIHMFKKIMQHCYSGQTFYLILDKAEKLREREGYVLPGFLSMQELSGCNVCVILISEIPWDKYRGATSIGFKEPLSMFFPSYTKEELLKILCYLRPLDIDESFYSGYISTVLSVFFTACRDLRELRHMAELNYPLYTEPIEKGNATPEDRAKLWKNIHPHLLKSLHTLYLRQISGRVWESQVKHSLNDEASNKPLKSKTQLIELPFYSKFLLIAAYIASYNPSITDRRFFVKHAGKMKKTAASMKKNEQKSAHLRGPKAFPLDRMMAIFYSITEGGVLPTAHIFSQISTLVTLQLLAHIGHEDQIDMSRYKCIVSLDFVQAIAKTVQFDIVGYLYDFI